MAAMACATIERAIWIQFWKAHDLDPRVIGEQTPYKKEEEGSSLLIFDLLQFFDSIDENKRLEIVGSIDKHLEIYYNAKIHFEQNQRILLNSDSEISQNNQILPINYDGNLSFLYSRSLHSGKIAEEVAQNFQNLSSRNFIEYLFFTSFNRIATSLDIIARKVLFNIISEFSDRKAEDLIKEVKIGTGC